MPTRQFDHEKLEVYQHSLRFVAWAGDLLDRLPKTLSAHNQLARASTSIPLNIAEGPQKPPHPIVAAISKSRAAQRWSALHAWMFWL